MTPRCDPSRRSSIAPPTPHSRSCATVSIAQWAPTTNACDPFLLILKGSEFYTASDFCHLVVEVAKERGEWVEKKPHNNENDWRDEWKHSSLLRGQRMDGLVKHR